MNKTETTCKDQKTVQKPHNIFYLYNGITRYAGVPTSQLTGRLHYNENLFGPSPKCLEVLRQTTVEDICLYDSTDDCPLIQAVSERYELPKEYIFLHNGSAELMKTVFSIMLERGDSIMVQSPGWSYYSSVASYKGAKTITYNTILDGGVTCRHDIEDILSKAKAAKPKVIVITSPAMPTGQTISQENLVRFIEENPTSLVLVDEAYAGYRANTLNEYELASKYENVVFSRTFSKYYGLGGMRLGYGIAGPAARSALWLDLPLYQLPLFARRVAAAAVADAAYYDKIGQELNDVKAKFIAEVNKIKGVHAYESDSNFVFLDTSGYDLEAVRQFVFQNGYLIRSFTAGGEEHLRITMGPRDIIVPFLEVFKTALLQSRTKEAE